MKLNPNNFNYPGLLAMMDDPDYIFGEHLVLLHEYVLKMVRGDFNRLMVNMPPRHGKSWFVCVYFATWYLLNHPDKDIIIACYGVSLAENWGAEIIRLVQKYGDAYGVKLRGHQPAVSFFKTNHGGSVRCTGVSGTIVGTGAHLFIIDDPVKDAEQAASPRYREKTVDWYKGTALNRLEPGGMMVLIQTRWHIDDLSGYLEKNEDEWKKLKLPAIALDHDILGREPGEVLFPERWSLEEILMLKKNSGSYYFSALFQQEPIAAEHVILPRKYFQYYNRDEISSFDFIWLYWDTAYDEGQENDFTVCLVWGMKNNKAYLLERFKGKVQFPDLVEQVKSMWETTKAIYNNVKGNRIEDKGSGKSLIQQIKRKLKGIPVKGVTPTKSKILRAQGISSYYEQGVVYHPEDAPWLSDFENELVQFPMAKHDDQVDATTMALEEIGRIIDLNSRAGNKSRTVYNSNNYTYQSEKESIGVIDVS